MIVVKLLGIDQYQAGELVRDIHSSVAEILETDPTNVVFYAPDSFIYYKGVDQTSYQLDVEIQLPMKYHPLEERINDCLVKLLKESHVHIRVLFDYFEEEHEHLYIDEEYPRFMTEDNMAHFEYEENDHNHHKNEKEDIFLGNAFAEYEERVKEKEQEQLAQESLRLKTKK